MRAIGIIPARYASTRFPGKPLAVLGDKTIIQRVWEQAVKARSLGLVVVATDDAAIQKHVEGFGGRAVMTSPEHPSGTDRVYEALQLTGESCDVVVNIQGDEPFIDPAQIDALVEAFATPATSIASMARIIGKKEDVFDPNVVKVVFDDHHNALYFSRSPIPYLRDTDREQWHEHKEFYQHIGLYAYRPDTLAALTALPPSRLEKAEKLEQLRWLSAGYAIAMVTTDTESYGIDTYEDLIRAKKLLDRK